MTNQERRDAHLAYIADKPIFKELVRTRGLIQKLNAFDRTDEDGIHKLVQELLGTQQVPYIVPPFYCDYGNHISVGKNVFFNYNCTLLDVGKITIGDNCMLAPGVAIYTAGHPLHPDSRNSGYEYGMDVTIGNNVWIGANVTILPNVTHWGSLRHRRGQCGYQGHPGQHRGRWQPMPGAAGNRRIRQAVLLQGPQLR